MTRRPRSSRRAAPALAAAAVAALVLAPLAASVPPADAFTKPSAKSEPESEFEPEIGARAPMGSAGHVTLEWSSVPGAVHELQTSDEPGFGSPTLLYAGPDTATFVSGLEDGEHFFRVRARRADSETWGPWSEPIGVPVAHTSLGFAIGLAAAGAVVFGLTVACVVIGDRSTRAEVRGG